MRSIRRGPAVTVLAALVLAGGTAAYADGNTAVRTTSTTEAPTATSEPPSEPTGSTVPPVIDPGDGGNYAPQIDPAKFVDVIDNPYLPFPVGGYWRYEGDSDGEHQVIEITVSADRRDIMGIPAVIVRDTLTVAGEVREDTYDWYAQDVDGNVWYLGEDTREYEGGQVVSTAGSWEAGVDGGLPGIVMPGAPAVGDAFRQELLVGEAEDMMEIISVDDTMTVGAGEFSAVVTTRDWTPLEPDVIEEKSYAPGVGKISEDHVAGADGHVELVEVNLGS